MLSYIAKRLIVLPLMLLGITIIVFFSIRLVPGDPARMIAGHEAPAAAVEGIRERLGLNKPIYEQLTIYIGNVVKGDLGTSIRSGKPVMEEIGYRFINTLKLAVLSIILIIIIGVPAGIASASHRYSAFDHTVTAFTLLGICAPTFWIGLMLQLVFAVYIPIFPLIGGENLTSLILPAITISCFSLANVTRMTRTNILEVMNQDYIRTARSKGLSNSVVLNKHALRNAMINTLTIVGLEFGTLLGGAVLTESVFAYPGLGRYMVQAIFMRDYPVVQGVVLVFAVTYVIVNMLTDVGYALLDPRIRLK